MSRFLLVEIEDGLPAYRHVGLFHALRLHAGVRSVTDLEAISAETLESYLLGPTEVVVVPERIEQLAF